jgi:hypothetical protein
MKEKKINLILIQIDEAHSSAWPIGLKDQVEPQKDFNDRVKRANEFNQNEKVPFDILIDSWDNEYSTKYKSWPDKFYCLDKNKIIIAKSEYRKRGDALIDIDICDIIEKLIK